MLITSQSDHTADIFLLEGNAGTGKTSTIMYLLKLPEFDSFRIAFSAPTNKALNVMMEKLNDKEDHEDLHSDSDHDDGNGKWKFITVFKLVDSKVSINSSGVTLFESGICEEITFPYEIIVIDESSMIEKKQLETILHSVSQVNRNLGVRPIVIFMGDIGQLPPVGETSSMIFDPSIQSRYSIKKLTLNQIMRSLDHLTNLSQQTRQLIPFPTRDLVGHDINGIDLSKICCDQIQFFGDREQWLNQYNRVFKQNLVGGKIEQRNANAPIILVYTNAECDALNTDCRNLIFDHPEEQFVTSELLIFKGYYCLKRQKPAGKTYCVKFFTSEPVIVEQVIYDQYTIPNFNLITVLSTIPTLTTQLSTWLMRKIPAQRYEYVNNDLITLVSTWKIDPNTNQITTHNQVLDACLNKIATVINKMNHTYIVNYLKVDGYSKLDSDDLDPDNLAIKVIAQQSMEQYLTNHDKIKLLIKTNYQLIRNLNDNTKLLIDFIFQKLWTTYYYRTYTWPFASINYGYAITTHKSQGSTYQQTFVNISNILGCSKVEAIVRAKSLYTAMTRAAKSINLLYMKKTLLPIVPNLQTYQCHVCGQTYHSKLFMPNNYTIDKQCAEKLLSQIHPVHLYVDVDPSSKVVIFSDKYKNLYPINTSELDDLHVNDAYQYIIDHHLQRSELDRYQYSNLMMIKKSPHLSHT
jgi:hypothetical protein